jgi:ABC-2 type transport system ATP-binding protein
LRRSLWDYVRKLNAAGTTVVLTTHYLEEAQEMCDTIAIINQGNVVACEPTANLLKRLNYRTLVVWPSEKLDEIPTPLKDLEPAVRKDGALAITYRTGETSIEQLLTRVRSAGVSIADLATEEPDLEDVFVALTSG